MTDEELLIKIKAGLGIVGNYQDDTLQVYIDEVKEFILDAGVNKSVVNSSAAVGCILKGVNDLMDLQPGASKFSPYFIQRVVQLSLKSGVSENV